MGPTTSKMSEKETPKREPGTVQITLDDGYTCIMSIHSLSIHSGYVKKELSGRMLDSFSHDVHIPRLRRDLWLSFENFIPSRIFSIGEGPIFGIRDMAQAGRHDIRIGNLDLEIHRLLELMLMGELLDAPAFENAAIDQLILAYRRFYHLNFGRVPLGNAKYIFENTKSTYLRDLISDVMIFAMSEGTVVQAYKEDHLSEDILVWLDARDSAVRYKIRDAPWDHTEQYHKLTIF
jgi:hypothetical protein